MRDACIYIAWRPFCNTYYTKLIPGFPPVPETTSLSASYLDSGSACQSGQAPGTSLLISQSGRQGNDAEIRYHYKALLLVEWRQLHGPPSGLAWLARGYCAQCAVGFLTTQCRPSWRDPLRIEITRQPLHRFDVAARVGSESNRKSPSYCCRLAYVVDPRRRLRARY